MSNIIRNNYQKLFFVEAAEMIMFFAAQKITGIICRALLPHLTGSSEMYTEFFRMFTILMLFSIHIVICVIFMLVLKPNSISYLRFNPRQLAVGFACGMLMNSVLCVGAIIGSEMNFSYLGFTLLLLPVFFANIVQCSAEEVLLRAFVPAFLEEKYSWDVIAFLSGILFIFHHVYNMFSYGFSPVFCLEVFLTGCLMIIVTKHTHNMWWAVGQHSAWNFTQEYIFGLPNSGMSSTLAIFKSENAKSCFWYNEVYGNEGALFSVVVLLIAIVLVTLYFNKRKVK